MRIAILTNAYPPKMRGGAGRIAELHVELLRKLGHEVQVWTTSLEWTEAPFWKRILFHLRDLVWRHPYAEDIIAWKPEVVMTHNLTGGGFGTPSAIQKTGVRWIHVLHDVQLFHPLGLLENESRITVLQRWATRARLLVFGRPELVLSPTQWLLNAHTRRGWFRNVETAVVPNPAPARVFSDARDWRVQLTILYIGRVSKDKGEEVLQGLMASASRPIHWRIVGGGASRLNNAPVTAGSFVSTQEEVGSAQVLEEMQKADLLLVPSQIEENQPTVLLEAFACGLPVVAQAKGGIPETLSAAGVLVTTHETNAWWHAIEQLCSEPRSLWSERGLRAWQRHDPEVVAEALGRFLKSNKKM